MSYNGIGLSTARGSGTSGYVQKNLSNTTNTKKKQGYYESRQAKITKSRETSKGKVIIDQINKQHARLEILKHDNLRSIEVKCSELRDDLEDQDIEQDEIDKQVNELRERLTLELVEERDDNKDKDKKKIEIQEYVPRYPSDKPRTRGGETK